MIINLQSVPDRTGSNYPAPFKTRVAGRSKKRVGDAAGLNNFGVNWVTLAPGGSSALRHWHEKQDEFVYIIEGELTLVTDAGEQALQPGMMAGFPAGESNGHHLVNHSDAPAVYLEIGDRTPNDRVYYPDDDLLAKGAPTGWTFTHKDGQSY